MYLGVSEAEGGGVAKNPATGGGEVTVVGEILLVEVVLGRREKLLTDGGRVGVGEGCDEEPEFFDLTEASHHAFDTNPALVLESLPAQMEDADRDGAPRTGLDGQGVTQGVEADVLLRVVSARVQEHHGLVLDVVPVAQRAGGLIDERELVELAGSRPGGE